MVALAQSAEVKRIQASKLTSLPTIDGVLSPGEWDSASHVQGFVDPVTGKQPQDQSEVWIGYDADAIYIAFSCHDAKPGAIVAREIVPGSWFNGEDNVFIRINPYGNRLWDGQSRFTLNAINTQSDDIAGGRSAKKEWRGDWQSATKKTADGWVAEIRIPWKVLDYPATSPANMDVEFGRYQARTQVLSRWACVGRQDRPEEYAIWAGVEPPRPVSSKRKAEYMAYLAPEYEDSGFRLRAGADARLRLTEGLTGLFSVTPDFKNIESQVAGIGFTRTERYLDDSRPFFTEGGGFFGLTGGHSFGQMFYSRRINSFDMGAKVYGQITPSTAVGALATFDFGDEQAAVVRGAKTFGKDASMSLYATHYAHNGEDTNTAYGINGWVRRGPFSLGTSLASEGATGSGRDSAGGIDLVYEVPKVFHVLHYDWVDPSFAPPLGYIPWTDRKGWNTYNEWNVEYRGGAFTGHHGDLYISDYKTYAGDEQERSWGTYWTTATRHSAIQVGAGHSESSYYGVGENLTSIDMNFNYNNRFKRIGFFLQSGARGSEHCTYGSIGGSYRVAGKVDLGLDMSRQDYQGTSDQQIATVGYEMTPTRSLTGRVVRSNGDTNAYLAYKQAGSKGMDLFVIFGDPNAATTQTRLSVKAVWAF